MNSRETLPMMLSANDIQTMGFTRTMAYNILNRDDVPVVKSAVGSLFRGISFLIGWTAERKVKS